ncbi:MAG: V-type ATPase kDa subunit [Clostridia bacterium]|jgi:V/A-type H+-transporting ATPase subunit I|nr:V-type ATPase kDa subunit [Clostridia bacterium]
MAIVKMKKAHIIALQSEKQNLIKMLQKFGGLHVINIEEQITEEKYLELTADSDNANVSQLEARLSQVKYSLDFINKYDKAKKSSQKARLHVSDSEYMEYINSNEELDAIFNQCKEIDLKNTELKNRETKLTNLIQLLQPWNSLESNFQDIKTSRNTVAVIGYVSSVYAEDFKRDFLITGELAYYEEVSNDKENTYILLVFHRDLEEQITQIQKQFGWSKSGFTDLIGSARENIVKLDAEAKELQHDKEVLATKAEQLVKHKSQLGIMQDIFTIERDKASIVSNFGKTEKTFVLSGWIPVKYAEKLEEVIKSVTQSYVLDLEDPADGEEPPVMLQNAAIVKPAEFVTEQYSLPHPYGIDPNAIMLPFYVIFFGMMVSDAVYGIVLAVATAIALIVMKPEGGLKKILGLIFMGGLSTLFWGALFGGWAGDLIKIRPLMFNPLDDPMKMLGLCLAMGVVHLFVGIGLQAYKNIRNGNVMDAIYDQGFWFTLIIGIMLLFLPSTAVVGKYMAIIGAAGMVLFAGRSKKNIVMRLLSGVLSLYGLTGFLGDVLSYLRLFALGLATGVIATVVNSMALMLKGSVVGYIFMVIFLIFGHVFNIAINTLGAYVHSSRLQYVEFFGKFYEGEGKAFKPFTVKTKYIKQQ